MNRCEFEPTLLAGEHRCRRCGALRPSERGPERIHRWCDAIELPEARPRHRGLGDTLAHVIDVVSAGRARPWAEAIARGLGRSGCGCDERREQLNRAVPYSSTAPVELAGGQSSLLLRMPHGLGDAVQMTVVLRHLRHYYPTWSIDVAAKLGAHSLFNGLCRRAYLLGEEPADSEYAIARTLAWEEPASCYGDSPATKAERCLRDIFRLQPIDSLCGYQIQVSEAARGRAGGYLDSISRAAHGVGRSSARSDNFPVVLFHYQGNSAQQQKSLDEEIVAMLVRRTFERGLVPVVLDWDLRHGLNRIPGVCCPGADHPLWLGTGTGDGETLAALIDQSSAMLAIDSGPGHIAGATQTPTLLVWRGHHPLHYYALAPHVRHAVPVDHPSLLRSSTTEALSYFHDRYDYRLYADLRRGLLLLFDELLDGLCDEALRGPCDGAEKLIVDGDLWVRREHRAADRTIVRDVYDDDCYGVDRLAFQPRFVVDIGAHLGSFAARIERRLAGESRVICVEADRRNLAALDRNVGRFATIVPAACTYAATPIRLSSSIFAGTDNTGASNITSNVTFNSAVGSPGELVDRVKLDEIVARFELPRIDVLKLDCEGCELSLLANARCFERVRLIVGEWHDRQRFLEIVSQRFSAWRLRILREGELGLFWLENPRFGECG